MNDPYLKKAIIVALLLLFVGVASVAYYFTIALPKHNRSRLEFEVEKYRDQQKQEELKRSEQKFKEELKKIDDETKAKMEQIDRDALDACLDEADAARIRYVEKNGGVKRDDGWIEAPRYVWDDADKKMKTAKDDCYKRYKGSQP